MSRFTTSPPSQLPADLKPYSERLEKRAESSFGPSGSFLTYRNEEGGLIGPFAFLLDSKAAGASALDHMVAISEIPGLPKDAKEVALLVVGTRFQAGYELYAHSKVAVHRAGVSQSAVDAIKKGTKPEGLSEAAAAAYDAAYSLAYNPGPLPQTLFDACIRHLGKDGTIALIHYIGYYSYVSVFLNASDAAVPTK